MRFNIAFEPSTGVITLEYHHNRYPLRPHLGYWNYRHYLQHWGYTTYDLIDGSDSIHYLMLAFHGPRSQCAVRAIEALRFGDRVRLADRILEGPSFKDLDMGQEYIQVKKAKKIIPYHGEDALPEITLPLSLLHEWHFGPFQDLIRE